MGVAIDPTAPFKIYQIGFRAFKSPPIYNELGRLRAFNLLILMQVGSIATPIFLWSEHSNDVFY